MRGLLLAALTEAAIITWRDVSNQKMLPLPSDYVAVAVAYGGLGLLPASAEGTASLIGWGLVLATFLNLWSPGSPFKLAFPGGTSQTVGPSSPASSTTAAPGTLAVPGPGAQTFATPNPKGGSYPVKAQ